MFDPGGVVACIERAGDQRLRVEVIYRWEGTAWHGDLDALRRPWETPTGCEQATTLHVTSVLAVPALGRRVSRATTDGWVQGPPQTPVIGTWPAGSRLEPEAMVVSDGTRWFRVLAGPLRVDGAPMAVDSGWVEGSDLRCERG